MKSKKIIIINFFIIFLFLTYPSSILTFSNAENLDTFDLKWQTTTGLNGFIGPITFDVNGDGIQEIFLGGRRNSAQGYNGREGRILCINGLTGSITWEHNFPTSYVDYYVPMAIGDLNNDATYELVFVNNTHTVALNAEDGSNFWNVPIRSGWHQLVIADVDGTALPYVYVTDHSYTAGQSKISKIRGYDGALIAQTNGGYSCYGGVSAADVDGQGTYIFAVSDETSGDNFKGARFYDENLNLIFNDDGVICSSNAISFIDIDGDTILEAIALRQGSQTSGGIYVWKWNTGTNTYERYPGKYGYNLGLGCHEQPVVGDFNNDGTFHLITAYGTVPQIWDLTNWELVGTLTDAGTCSKAPDVANVMGDQSYEIIAHTWSYGVRIFDTNYNLLETLPFWAHYSVVDDIDNDAKNEIVLSGNNTMRAYDTLAQAPSQPVRADNSWYGERRTRVAEYYLPIGSIFGSTNHPPYTPSNFNPSNGATNIALTPQLSWSGGDPDASDTVTYDVYFGINNPPPKVSSNQIGTTYSPSTLNYDTTYYLKIVACDNHGASTSGPIIHFTTEKETTTLIAEAGGPYSGSQCNPISFSGSASGGSSPYTYTWTFGDGGSGSGVNPSHQYNHDGSFTATITVTDDNEMVDTDTATVTISTSSLIADAGGPYNGIEDDPISFSGSASGGCSPYSYIWDWDDGSTDGSGQNPSHTYSNPGDYTIAMTVTDDAGNIVSDTVSVHVELISINADAGSPYSNYVNEPIQFYGSASGGYPPYSWSWDFGDGSSSSEQNPLHQYSASGDYTVWLTVTDTLDQMDNDPTTVHVLEVGELLVDAGGPYHGLVDDSIQFAGYVNGGNSPYEWLWDFGDGNKSTDQNPSHIFLYEGQYYITLKVTDKNDFIGQDSANVLIYGNQPPKKPKITGIIRGKTEENHPYEFTSTDPEGDKIYYFIDWGDETNSGWIGPYTSGITVKLTHSWNTTGEYEIKGKAKDIYDTESGWATIAITMPKYVKNNVFFLRLLEHYFLLYYLFNTILSWFYL